MAKPLIIQFLNLLHKHGDPNAPAVRKFVAAHVDNEKFIERAFKLRTIFTMSTALVQAGLMLLERSRMETNKEIEPNKSYDCIHCGWAMGEKEGEPLCSHCEKKEKGTKKGNGTCRI